MSSYEWKNWCRLCAGNTENEMKLDAIKSVSNTLQKIFRISIFTSDDYLSIVCQDCLNLVLKLEKFALRCTKVNDMFKELLNDGVSDDKIELLRQKYGLSDNNESINIPELDAKVDQPISTHQNTPSGDAIKIQVTTEVMHAKIEERDSDNAVNSDRDEDVPYNPKTTKTRKEFNINSQSRSRKRKQSTIVNEIPSTAKKRKEIIIDSKPKSTKRKHVKGTDVWCHLCDTTFEIPRLYMEHMRGKHTPDVLPFGCAQCSKFFVTEKKMILHAACHRPAEQKQIHPCPECGKKFTEARKVPIHIQKVHMGDRPFVCEKCGKACTTSAALKQHQVTHTDVRPFKCSDCQKCFKDLAALKKHSEIHNTDLFECSMCGQRLSTRYTLKVHMLVHSDAKRYECKHCGNKYKRHTALKNHLILHSGMRPFACPFCDVTYANGANLRTHKKKCHPAEVAAMDASQPSTGNRHTERVIAATTNL